MADETIELVDVELNRISPNELRVRMIGPKEELDKLETELLELKKENPDG